MKKQISLLLMLLNIFAFLLSPISAYAGSQPIADQNIDTIDASNLDSANTTEFQYDDLYRLTRASSTNAVYGGDYLQTYAYNAIGNITNKSDQGNYGYEGNTGTRYENPHAATSISPTQQGGQSFSFTHDSNGNVTSDSVWDYTWDYRNRLIEATNGTSTLRYGYDHEDNRIWAFDGVATTTYPNKYYNLSSTGTSTVNIFANNQLVATIEGNVTATSTYYIHTDHLSGTNVVTDENGEVVQLLDYYPFGGIMLDERSGSIDEKRKAYGHEYDADTGLYYMISRYQNPQIGRFNSIDPAFLLIGDNKFEEKYNRTLQQHLSNPQSLNSYSYANNNPLTYKDEKGEILPLLAAIGAAIWGAAEIGLSALDAYSTYQTVSSSNYSFSEKSAAVGLFGLGLIGPGAGYGTIGEVAATKSIKAKRILENAAKGKAGEAASGLVKNTQRIPSLSGTANFRVPDSLNMITKTLSEVKNTTYQGVTGQIRDFIQFSQRESLKFELYVRENTTLSKGLQQLRDSGVVNIKFLPK